MASMRRSRLRALLSVGAVVSLSAIASEPAAQSPRPAHHRSHGFQNNYVDFEPKGLAALIRWRLEAAQAGLPKPPASPTPSVAPELDFMLGNAGAGRGMQPALTWIGHATLLLQTGGLNVLTDPMFSERASPLAFIGPKRQVRPGLALAELPHVDVVVISHNHYDHLDAPSVRALGTQPGGSPLFLVPLGLKAWMAEQGLTHVVELDWWQEHAVGAVAFVLTPVQHWSGRTLSDRMETLWGGWAILAPDLHAFFAGDTGYSKDFADIRAHFAERQSEQAGGGFDIALLPIGGYEPRWFMAQQHVEPAEAVRIHLELGAKRSIGMHWGTFQLTDEALDQPPLDLAAARTARGLPEDAFSTMAVGQTLRLARRDTR